MLQVPPPLSPPAAEEDADPSTDLDASAELDADRERLSSVLRPLRSRAGCWTCREKKVKCDEGRPQCRRCSRLHRQCDYEPRPRKAYARRSQPQQQQGQLQRLPHLSDSIADGSIRVAHETPRGDSPLRGMQSNDARFSPVSSQVHTHTTSPSAVSSIHITTPSQYRVSPVAPEQQHVSARPDSPAATAPTSEVSPTCSEILQPSDYEAIHCFQFILGPSIDRKQPGTTVLATMWKLARHSQMVLHMVCALGAQQLCYEDRKRHRDRHEHLHKTRRVRAAEHYGSALHLLGIAASQDAGSTGELDLILATLWLMLEYEQRFGDGCGSGLSAHLKGAASILENRLHKPRDICEDDSSLLHIEEAQFHRPLVDDNRQDWPISDFACRIVVWISYKDGAAALNGFGGFFNELVGEAMADPAEDYATSLARGFDALHKRANRAYSIDWDPLHPQDQLLEDIHSRPLFYLYGNTGQVRFLLSRLVEERDNDEAAFQSLSRQIARLLNGMADRYADFIDVAHTLHLDSSGAHGSFVINARIVCAHYHAAVLCYLRIVGGPMRLSSRQRAALGHIMNIGYLTCADSGESAVSTLAWPLFVVALESDDALHRTWILDRYESLSEQGENYRRAHAALKAAFAMQRLHERRVDLLDLLRNTSRLNRFLI